MTIVTLFGHAVTLPEVANAVMTYFWPAVSGAVSSVLAQLAKRGWNIVPSTAVEIALLRITVAAACVALNIIGLDMMHEPITWSLVGTSFVSYFAASATYVHFF